MKIVLSSEALYSIAQSHLNLGKVIEYRPKQNHVEVER